MALAEEGAREQREAEGVQGNTGSQGIGPGHKALQEEKRVAIPLKQSPREPFRKTRPARAARALREVLSTTCK